MANLKRIKILSLVLIFFFLFMGRVYALELSDIPLLLDWRCLDLKILGPCVRPSGVTGIIVMYWEPVLLIETVKRPGDTIIGSMMPVISEITKDVADNLSAQITGLGNVASSGSSYSNISQANLQFNEVHVYEFPFRDEIMAFIDVQCPDKLPTGSFIKYLSELDFMEWRTGALEAVNPKTIASISAAPLCGVTGPVTGDLCMGSWGATYPRTGFLTHQSEVVGSAACAIRAVSISGLLGSMGHVVLEETGFAPSFEGDKLELIYPVVSGPIAIGENPIFWESGKLSQNGKYLWVYWRRRICCVF